MRPTSVVPSTARRSLQWQLKRHGQGRETVRHRQGDAREVDTHFGSLTSPHEHITSNRCNDAQAIATQVCDGALQVFGNRCFMGYPGVSIEACPACVPERPGPLCAFTVDVEDWYQSSVDFDAPISDRVVRNCDRLLALLDECGVKATFFVQGLVAEAFPSLVRTFLQQGHEVQSHGHSHRPLFAMSRAELERELEFARKTVEDASGVKVTMFRAQDFSIDRQNLWALDLVAAAGFEVDSSIFPMRTKRYGITGWPAGPSRLRLQNGAVLLEAPVAVLRYGAVCLPVAGGGYFRLLPRALLRSALASITAAGRPAIVYCHPYEISPREIDEFKGRVSPTFLLSQRMGWRHFGTRIRHLFDAMPFGRMDTVLANAGLL